MSSFGGQAVRFRRWGRCVFGGGGRAGAVSAVGALLSGGGGQASAFSAVGALRVRWKCSHFRK